MAITPATLTVTGATTSNVYTGALQTNAYSTSALLAVTDTVTGVSGLATGTNVMSATADTLSAATGTGLTNYSINYVNGSLTIVSANTPPSIPTDTIVYLQSSTHSSPQIAQDDLLCPAIFSAPLATNASVKNTTIPNKCATAYWNPSLQIFNDGVLLPSNGAN